VCEPHFFNPSKGVIMNWKRLVIAMTCLNIAEPLCPHYLDHSEPHPPHHEAVEPVRMVVPSFGSGVMPTNSAYWQMPYPTGSR
jgi:hypothetical protein